MCSSASENNQGSTPKGAHGGKPVFKMGAKRNRAPELRASNREPLVSRVAHYICDNSKQNEPPQRCIQRRGGSAERTKGSNSGQYRLLQAVTTCLRQPERAAMTGCDHRDAIGGMQNSPISVTVVQGKAYPEAQRATGTT